MTWLRLLSLFLLAPMVGGCPSPSDDDDAANANSDDANSDDANSDDDDSSVIGVGNDSSVIAVGNDDDSADDDSADDDDDDDDDDSSDDDDDDDDSAPLAPCGEGDPLDGAQLTVHVVHDDESATPLTAPACLHIGIYGHDLYLADVPSTLIASWTHLIDEVPTDVPIALPSNAHERIEYGGDDPVDNRFRVSSWLDVNRDGEACPDGDLIHTPPNHYWSDPPPAETTTTLLAPSWSDCHDRDY